MIASLELQGKETALLSRRDEITKLKKLSEQQRNALLSHSPELRHFFVAVEVEGFLLHFLSMRAFKWERVYSSSQSPRLHFRSSGTTDTRRSLVLHNEESLELYLKASSSGFTAFLKQHAPDAELEVLSLVPPTTQWPESSLAAMLHGFEQKQYLDANDPVGIMQTFQNVSDGRRGKKVLFGTSLHHLLLIAALKSLDATNTSMAARPLLEKLYVVDTGGTKTRTTDLAPEEMFEILTSGYAHLAKEVIICSEFGMCELSNQAYASKSLREFHCNDGLVPFSLEGTLAFGDLANTSTYCLILTEDLATLLDDKSFFWEGRHLDASIKGCSLNVPQDFSFSLQSIASGAPLAESKKRDPSFFSTTDSSKTVSSRVVSSNFVSSNLVSSNLVSSNLVSSNLVSSNLPPFVWEDLDFSLQQVQQHLSLLKSLRLQNPAKRPLCIVASANSPLAVVYPMAWAFGYGALKVTVKLPSLRRGDAFSGMVVHALQGVVEHFANDFEGMILEVCTSLDDPKSDEATLVFGSNQTLEVFSKKTEQWRRYFKNGLFPWSGFGQCTNAVAIQHEAQLEATSESMAEFLGRGCLSPAVLFWGVEADLEAFSRSFFDKLSSRRRQSPLLKAKGTFDHFKAELSFLLGSTPHFIEDKDAGGLIVDLRLHSQIETSRLENTFSKAGAGVAFVLSPSHREALQHLFRFEDPRPTLTLPHNGIPWDETLKALLS